MLQQLIIQNVALIKRLNLAFDEGFHVLTGETGAGKSILIDAINFVLGERASRDIIKSGEAKAVVEAAFDIAKQPALLARLDEMGISHEEGDLLILSRELTLAGKNTCRVNGSLTNIAALKSVTDLLVDVHGQHAHQSLLDPSRHRGFLDGYGLSEIAPLLEAVRSAYQAYSKAVKGLSGGFTSEQERLRRIDVLEYQLEEIDKASLRLGEEETLAAQHKLYYNAQMILAALEESYEALSGEESGALGQADGAVRGLSQIATLSPDYEDVYAKLQEAYYAMEDVAYTLRDLKNGFEFQPEDLERVERRLDRIHGLKRKYGGSIREILTLRDEMEAEVTDLKQSEARREELSKKRDQAKRDYQKAAKLLSAARKAAARRLSEAVLEQLRGLGMEKAQFLVSIEPVPEEQLSENGLDRIEFLLSANAGEPPKPLSRVASGGELSRIMLAFKTVAAELDSIPTLIFDEIDSGISGHVAMAVGQRMRDIAKRHQVLCVTHLPQIAALAKVHFFVEKVEQNGKTETRVKQLDFEGRYKEIARIMGGSETDVYAIEHAKELIHKGMEAE